MPTIAYTGCRTTAMRKARGRGIEVFAVGDGGEWSHTQSIGGLVNPSYLLVDQQRLLLFCVHGDQEQVSSFRIDARDGTLTALNTQTTGGKNPVHLALTQHGDCLVVANYASGTVVALPVKRDGSLGAWSDALTFVASPGPHASEQRGPHPHQVLRIPGTDRFIFPDKGADAIWFAEFDSARLAWNRESLWRVSARPGAGPRHGVLHPTMPLLYIVNELDSTLATYRLDGAGYCELQGMAGLLPAGYAGANQSAGIVLDQKTQRLFVSNRGHDTLSVLDFDAGNGLPNLTGWVPSGGATPRFIASDPAQRNLIVANEGSDTITMFAIHGKEKREALGAPRCAVATGSPTCVAFFEV